MWIVSISRTDQNCVSLCISLGVLALSVLEQWSFNCRRSWRFDLKAEPVWSSLTYLPQWLDSVLLQLYRLHNSSVNWQSYWHKSTGIFSIFTFFDFVFQNRSSVIISEITIKSILLNKVMIVCQMGMNCFLYVWWSINIWTPCKMLCLCEEWRKWKMNDRNSKSKKKMYGRVWENCSYNCLKSMSDPLFECRILPYRLQNQVMVMESSEENLATSPQLSASDVWQRSNLIQVGWAWGSCGTTRFPTECLKWANVCVENKGAH